MVGIENVVVKPGEVNALRTDFDDNVAPAAFVVSVGLVENVNPVAFVDVAIAKGATIAAETAAT